MFKILYFSKTNVTARKIKLFLEHELGTRVLMVNQDSELKPGYYIVRWGSTIDISNVNMFNDRIINPRLFIYDASNHIFKSRANFSYIKVKYGIPPQSVVVVRDIINGRDSETVRIEDNTDGHINWSVYYSLYKEFVAEYRLLLYLNGFSNYWRIYKKLNGGEIFRLLRTPKIKGLKSLIESISSYLVYNYSTPLLVGVDVGRDSENKLTVIEFNSAPWLKDNDVEFFFSKYIRDINLV